MLKNVENVKNIEKLKSKIKDAIPLIVDEWNNTKISQLEVLFNRSFKDNFFHKQTQEKTKIVSPIINNMLTDTMYNLTPDFHLDESNGRDYKFNLMPIEGKISLSVSNSWTGNGYKKTDIHLLIKFNMDDDGVIISYFSLLVDLSECLGNWSETKASSNFSTLKFLREDYDKIYIIHGEMIKNHKKYLDIKQKKV